MRHYKLDKMANFMEIKCINPKLKQSEIAREMKRSPSTLQRYRKEMKTFSPYRIPNTHTRKQKSSGFDHKMTSKDQSGKKK